MQLLVLHHHRDHGVAADLEVDHGRAGVQRVAEVARGNLERTALAAAAAVDDAGHEAGLAQAAHRARPLLGALLDGQLWALRGSHDGGAVYPLLLLRPRLGRPRRVHALRCRIPRSRARRRWDPVGDPWGTLP